MCQPKPSTALPFLTPQTLNSSARSNSSDIPELCPFKLLRHPTVLPFQTPQTLHSSALSNSSDTQQFCPFKLLRHSRTLPFQTPQTPHSSDLSNPSDTQQLCPFKLQKCFTLTSDWRCVDSYLISPTANSIKWDRDSILCENRTHVLLVISPGTISYGNGTFNLMTSNTG